MSADLLRRAAALMRERARRTVRAVEDAGAWSASWDHSVITSDAAQLADCFDSGLVAEHIASWHPAVSLAVADLLDSVARTELHRSQRETHEFCDGDCDVVRALAVATAYLGGES